MSKFEVTVQLIMTADDEDSAYRGAGAAVDNLVGGDILAADVESVSDFPTAARRVPLVIAGIDWELLRQQKAQLLAAVDVELTGFDPTGIVHLIDAIQDAAVADGIAGEELVFGRDTEI